jgi:hypothetical protein
MLRTLAPFQDFLLLRKDLDLKAHSQRRYTHPSSIGWGLSTSFEPKRHVGKRQADRSCRACCGLLTVTRTKLLCRTLGKIIPATIVLAVNLRYGASLAVRRSTERPPGRGHPLTAGHSTFARISPTTISRTDANLLSVRPHSNPNRCYMVRLQAAS